jgi:hypothetical protein
MALVLLRISEQSLLDLIENVPVHVRRRMWFLHDGTPLRYTVRWIPERCFSCEVDWARRPPPPACPPPLNLHLFVWAFPRCLVYETAVEGGDDLPRIQAACDSVRQLDNLYFRANATVMHRCGLCIAVGGRHFVRICCCCLLMLKCLIIAILCQCYLWSIKVSPANYVWSLQSRSETSFLSLKKALQAIQYYLR